MGETRGACAWSRLTLTSIVEFNACERDVVQVDWIMEQYGPWALNVEASALSLTSDGELVR